MNNLTPFLIALAIPVSLWAGLLTWASLSPSWNKSQSGDDDTTSATVDLRRANPWRAPPRAFRLHRIPVQFAKAPPRTTRAGGRVHRDLGDRMLP